MCGETSFRRCRTASTSGLSPRVRGNRARTNCRLPISGSIPACAGKPFRWPHPLRPMRVYPRVCGETDIKRGDRVRDPGLSPRVRGNLEVALRHLPCAGSIPACVGKPFKLHNSPQTPWVYPRVCGETFDSRGQFNAVGGLSPRVRGNQDWRARHVPRHGSIPACAGKPAESHCTANKSRVYPRVCGETTHFQAMGMARPGLSPRVRGNRS